MVVVVVVITNLSRTGFLAKSYLAKIGLWCRFILYKISQLPFIFVIHDVAPFEWHMMIKNSIMSAFNHISEKQNLMTRNPNSVGILKRSDINT